MTAPRLAASPRNTVILAAVRDVLDRTLAVTTREAAIRKMERASSALPPPWRRLADRWAWRTGSVFVAADVLAVVIAWALTPGPPTGWQLLVAFAVTLGVANRIGLHRTRLELSVLGDLPAFVLTAVLAALAVGGVGMTAGGVPARSYTALLFGVALFALQVGLRAIAYPGVRALRQTRLAAHPVVVIGTGDVAQRLAGAMLAHREYGLRPVGFLDTGEASGAPARDLLPVLGGLDALPEVLTQFAARDVVFAFGGQPDRHLARVVRACVRMDLQVFVVPSYVELYGADRHAQLETLWGVPLVRLRPEPLRTAVALFERATLLAA